MVTVEQRQYAGFWRRVLAYVIDSVFLTILLVDAVLLVLVLSTLGLVFFGPGYLAEREAVFQVSRAVLYFFLPYVLPPIAVILFWVYASATPGKMAIDARIVRADTGERPTKGQFIGRYFAYMLSGLPLGLGFLWIAFDKRKQGWHDKLAGTVVVRSS